MSAKKACEVLMALARGEKQLEIQRQTLCQLPDFEPYATFRYLDSQHRNYLQTQDFQSFFSSNRVSVDPQSTEETLIRHYDYDRDGRLCYAEYLRMILPSDEPGLRTLVTQRPTFVGEIPEETLIELCKLLQTEVNTVKELEPLKRELGVSAGELFREIDQQSTGYINFASLFEFFKRNGVYPYEEEIIAIIRRLDKDDDGRLVLEELEEGLQVDSGYRGYAKQGDEKPYYKSNFLQEDKQTYYKSSAQQEDRQPYYKSNIAQEDKPYYKSANLQEEKPYYKSNNLQEDKPYYKSNNLQEDKPYYKSGTNLQSSSLYRNETFNQAGHKDAPYKEAQNIPYKETQNTSLKKSYKYESKYVSKFPYDDQLTEKGSNTAKFEDPSQEKLTRSYKNNDYNNFRDAPNYQKTTITSSYSKRPLKEPEENKDFAGQSYLKRDNSNNRPGIKNDYSIDPNTKSPPRTFYYPYEPIRKAFSPMKDKIMKSSRFEAKEDPYERKTKSQIYQATANNRTRTPIQQRNEPSWRIEDKLKKIDDNYAKNSRILGSNGISGASQRQEDITRSAPKQMLYRDYTPDPSSKRSLYKTAELTPDKLFETSYLQSSQYRKDRDIVDRIMGDGSGDTKSRTKSAQRRPFPAETRDFSVFLCSLMGFESEIERMKQDLALRPDFNLVDLFVFFDKEQKGFCSIEDFLETLKSIDLFVQEKEAILFISRVSGNDSNFMKFADFATAFTPILSDYVELLNQRKPINTDLQFSYRELFSGETLRLVNALFRAHFTNEIAIEGLRKALNRKEDIDLCKVFDAIDSDHDGFLVESEIEDFIAGEKGWNRGDLRLLLERMDKDRDGKVSFQEFEAELSAKLEDLE